jgi:hypothetical protein
MAPKTVEELARFYNDYVKLLYCSIESENSLPVEVLFEINAAWDHLSRIWIYKEPEEHAVSKAHSHLKRSCLDIFKLRVKKAIDQYNELKTLDLSYLDNGEYEKNLVALIHRIKKGAIDARRSEGDTRYDDEHNTKAFDKWEPVFNDAAKIETDFYLHPRLEWAKKKDLEVKRIITYKTIIISIVTSYVAGLLSTKWLISLFGFIRNKLGF